MELQAVKYKLCHFGDSTYELIVLIFAFKTGNAQYKMNKIHPNNLTFEFFFI